MVYTLLKKAIEQKNAFMTSDMIALQIEFFFTAGKITEEQRAELSSMVAGQSVEV